MMILSFVVWFLLRLPAASMPAFLFLAVPVWARVLSVVRPVAADPRGFPTLKSSTWAKRWMLWWKPFLSRMVCSKLGQSGVTNQFLCTASIWTHQLSGPCMVFVTRFAQITAFAPMPGYYTDFSEAGSCWYFIQRHGRALCGTRRNLAGYGGDWWQDTGVCGQVPLGLQDPCPKGSTRRGR